MASINGADLFVGSYSQSIAAGTVRTRAGAAILINPITIVGTSTVTSTNLGDGVLLPAATLGTTVVINNTPNIVTIYATGSETINGTSGVTGVAMLPYSINSYSGTVSVGWATVAASTTAASVSTTVGGFTRTQQARNNDVVNVKDYGAVADGVTDDYPAFLAARNSLSIRGGTIKVPAGIYKINSTINYDGISVILDGDGTSNQPTGGATTLLFAAGISGIIMRNNINGMGASSIVRNMKLVGSDVSAGANDGIRLQAHAAGVDNVCVTGFGGNGIHVLSGNPSDGALNANNFWIKNVRCNLNWLHGFFVEGLDSNVGLIENLDCSDNKQWGIYENGFLGNTYSAPHCDNNLAGDYRFGNIARGNTFTGAYCEIRATTGLQFDAGGPGGNYLQFSVFGSTIIDNSTNQDNIILSSSNYLNFKHLGIGKGNQGNATRFRVSGSDLAGLSQYGTYADPTIANPCNDWATFTSGVTTPAASFNVARLTHFQALGIYSLGAGSSVGTQTGFLVPAIAGAATNIAYRGQIAAATNNWNLYMDGTAANFLQGALTLGAGTPSLPSINWSGLTNSGIFRYGAYGTAISVGGTSYLGMNYNGVIGYVGMGSAQAFGWSAGTEITVSDALDTILVRDGAGIIGQKNAANAQEYRVYGTTTGPKYLSLKHDGTNAIVGANSGAINFGTGASITPQVQVIDTASAVNFHQLTGASTGNAISWAASGSDANINVRVTPKGIGSLIVDGGTSAASATLQVICSGTAGANLFFSGNGATSPTKYIRVLNGNLEVISHGYAGVILSLSDNGALGVKNTLNLASYTVATLPTGVQGDNAYVTNALGPTYGAAVAGGGAVVNRVFKNATQWVCA